MLKNSENNGTEEIGLVTPTPVNGDSHQKYAWCKVAINSVETGSYIHVERGHYIDVLVSAMASQITSVSLLYSTVCSCRSKKTSKLRVADLWEEKSPVSGEFPANRASYKEKFSIWWRHHGSCMSPLRVWKLDSWVPGLFSNIIGNRSYFFSSTESTNPVLAASSNFDYWGLVVVPIILLTGVLGNCMSITVMRSKAFASMSISLVLTMLALSDITLSIMVPFNKQVWNALVFFVDKLQFCWNTSNINTYCSK